MDNTGANGGSNTGNGESNCNSDCNGINNGQSGIVSNSIFSLFHFGSNHDIKSEL